MRLCLLIALLVYSARGQSPFTHISVAQEMLKDFPDHGSTYVVCTGTAAVFPNLTIEAQFRPGPCQEMLFKVLDYVPQKHRNSFVVTISATAVELNRCTKLAPFGLRVDYDIRVLYWIFECTDFAAEPANIITDPRSWEWFLWSVISFFFVVPIAVLIGNCVSDHKMYTKIEKEIQGYLKEADRIMEKKNKASRSRTPVAEMPPYYVTPSPVLPPSASSGGAQMSVPPQSTLPLTEPTQPSAPADDSHGGAEMKKAVKKSGCKRSSRRSHRGGRSRSRKSRRERDKKSRRNKKKKNLRKSRHSHRKSGPGSKAKRKSEAGKKKKKKADLESPHEPLGTPASISRKSKEVPVKPKKVSVKTNEESSRSASRTLSSSSGSRTSSSKESSGSETSKSERRH